MTQIAAEQDAAAERRWWRVPRPLLIVGLLVAGVALRVAWAVIRPDRGASGEAFNVARALGEGRGFADAYQLGQGATAHLLPISPGIAGAVYGLFGVRSTPAEFLLTCWALLCVFGAFLLLLRAFARLGSPAWARVGAFAFLCLSPAYVAQEGVDFRVWEGGLTSLLTAFCLDRMLAIETSEREPRPAELVVLGLAGALLFFVNPGFGLATAAAGGVLALRRLTLRQTAVTALSGALALLAMIVPWTVRNEHAVGAPVLLRSNAGLELALANHDAALGTSDPGAVFLHRLQEIHPAVSAAAYRRMRASGGEVAYSRELGATTRQWIASHPSATVRLAARHLRQVFAPEPWQFTTFGGGKAAGLRAALASVAGVIGLAGLFAGVARGRAEWLYPTIIVLVAALALSLFQPVPRYTYLFLPILTFAAGDLVARLGAAVASRRRGRPMNEVFATAER